MAIMSFFLMASCFVADHHSLRLKAAHHFDFQIRFKRTLLTRCTREDTFEAELEFIRLQHYLKNSEFAECFVPFLISQVNESVGSRSFLAAEFLRSISTVGQHAPIFSKMASSEPGKSSRPTFFRAIAIGLLGHIRSKNDLPMLAKIALTDKDVYLRERAIQALGDYGKDASGYILLLRGMLKEKEPSIRYYAANSLWKITHRTDGSLKIIEEFLLDDTSSFHKDHAEWIVESYCEMARFSPTSKPTLLKLLESKSKLTQLRAADAILYLDPRSEKALTQIETFFSPSNNEDPYPYIGSDYDIRLRTSVILSRFKSKKEVVLEFFVDQVKKQNSPLTLCLVLVSISSSDLDPKEKLALYIQGLQKPVPVARQISAEYLAELKEDALDSIPVLGKQLKQETDFLARYQMERSLFFLLKFNRTKK